MVLGHSKSTQVVNPLLRERSSRLLLLTPLQAT